jgi:hypothetical protein
MEYLHNKNELRKSHDLNFPASSVWDRRPMKDYMESILGNGSHIEVHLLHGAPDIVPDVG